MSRTISFKTDYMFPNASGAHYSCTWGNQVTVNGYLTTPQVLSNYIPSCERIRFNMFAIATSGNVTNRNWTAYGYKRNVGWQVLGVYYLPDNTDIECEFDVGFDLTSFVMVPEASGLSGTWTTVFSIKWVKYWETLTTVDAVSTKYMKNILPSQNGHIPGTYDIPCQVYAHLNFGLEPATAIYCNIGGELIQIPPVYSIMFEPTFREQSITYEFTPLFSGNYYFSMQGASYNYFKLYDEDMNMLAYLPYNNLPNPQADMIGGQVYYLQAVSAYNSDPIPCEIIIHKLY